MLPLGLTLRDAPDLAAITGGVLADLATLAPGPFERPMVMVRHPAMRRHLQLAVARAQGVAASLSFPAPLDLLNRLHGAPRHDPWGKGPLGWRIAALLPGLEAQLPDGIRRIVADPDPFVRIGFARRLAARLHDAMLHRPAMIRAWERGAAALRNVSDEQWHLTLWQALTASLGTPSTVARHDAWADALVAAPAAWPRALLVVSDATLPPLLCDALEVAARVIPVRWHLLASGSSTVDLHRPRRRPAALARVRTMAAVQRESVARWHPLAPETSLLGAAQRRLQDESPSTRPTTDGSLQVHCCHSPMREIETLRDELAWRLAHDTTLAPHDVTLYVTDLETYLPAIDAVLGTAEPGYPYVSYHVADRPWRSRSGVGAALEDLVAVLTGRFGRREVLALLDHLPIRAAADIQGEELPRLRDLTEQARIRWGLDAADRATRHDVPALDDGTWRAGLAALNAEHALAPEDDRDRALIARLTAWIERLAAWRLLLDAPRTADQWRVPLDGFLTEMLAARQSDDAEALGDLRNALERLLEDVTTAESTTPIPFATLQQVLADLLTQENGSGHLRGGLRVCRLEAGTVLPARVVMIAGLDDGRFPRGGGAPPWDILLQSRQDGDRDPLEAEDPDPREDALDAFRDAVLSASDAVHLSWVGRSLMDNAERSPSVALSELLDLVDDLGVAQKDLIRLEPLQPFAPALFGGDPARRASAAQRWASAAVTVRAGAPAADTSPPVRVERPLPEPFPLADLTHAVSDPPHWFWRRTLGLFPPSDAPTDDDNEPLLAADHQQLDLRTAWIAAADQDYPGVVPTVRRDVELGYGAIGAPVVAREALPLAAARAGASGAAQRRGIDVDLRVGGTSITGTIDRVGPAERLAIVPHVASGRILLRLWVEHLVLNASAPEARHATHLIGVADDRTKLLATFTPVDDPLPLLEDIVALARRAQCEPVPLFPKSAIAAAEAMVKDNSVASAVHGKWRGFNQPGEGDDAVIQRLWGGADLDRESAPALWEAFSSLVETIVVPMIRHRVTGQTA